MLTCWGSDYWGFDDGCCRFPSSVDFHGCDEDDGEQHHDKGGENG